MEMVAITHTWKSKILLKEAWNVDDTTFTSELQNVTIILPFMSKIFDNINVQKVFRDAYEEHVHPEIRSAIIEKLPLICYKYGTTLAQEYVDVKRWGKLPKEELLNFKCACHTPAMKPYIRSGSGHVCTTDPSIVAAAVPGSMRLANLLARGAKFRPEGCKIDFCETHGDSLYGHVQEEITHWLTLLMEKYGMPRSHFSKFESAFYQKVQEWEGVIEAEKDKADSIDSSAPFDPLPYEALEHLQRPST